MKNLKKYVSIIVVGLIILCGMEAVALPLNQANYRVEKSKQTPYEMQTNTTNLTITIFGGLGGGFIIQNVGEFNATDVSFHFNITYKRFNKNITMPGVGNHFPPLTPGESTKIWILLDFLISFGWGPINIEVTATADNALPVTKTAEGKILLFFVIIK